MSCNFGESNMDIANKKGSCFCGNISFTLESEPKLIINCHCDFCRSHTGSAFSSYIAYPISSFELSKDKEGVAEFTMENGTKYFCKNCGTPIYNIVKKNPEACMIYLGTLNNISSLTPRRNIWCDSRLEWVYNISSIKSLKQGIGRG